jgi:ketosteroid isomerase-like protein
MTDPLPLLLDRAAIADVLALYCKRIDEYDIDGLAELFTEDVTTDYGPGRGGPVAGRQQVRDLISRGQAEVRRTHHQLGQSRLEIDGDTASALTYVTAWHRDGTRSCARLRYIDQLQQTPPAWLITSRRVETGRRRGDGRRGVDLGPRHPPLHHS